MPEQEHDRFLATATDPDHVNYWDVGRMYHPILPGADGGALSIYGTEGNLIFGAGHRASIVSTRTDLLPHVDEDGWFHIPLCGDRGKAKWPQPGST